MYLLALNVVCVVAVFFAFPALFTFPSSHEEARRYVRSSAPYALMMLGTMLSCAPLVATLMSASEEIAIDSVGSLFDVWLSLAGGVLWLLALALIIRKELGEGRRQSFALMGRNVLGGLSSLVVAVAAVQQISFVEKNTGMMNLGLVKKVAESRGINLDLDCKASVVLATFEEGKPVHLRCPKLLTLNPLSRYPFAPWPDYQDIESEELAGLVVQVSKEAKELN